MNFFSSIYCVDSDSVLETELLKRRREDYKVRLCNFADESNRIEGIYGNKALNDHQRRLEKLLAEDTMSIAILCEFNTAGALRTQSGMNVFIGNHEPKPGGMHIMYALDDTVAKANAGIDPYIVHHEFEKLHPFLDGNGRTGRALWLWQMMNQEYYSVRNNFLQQWYYQSLDRGRNGD